MKKKGISLIVLVITIIVIVILATAMIVSIANNNPISKAKEATVKQDFAAMQDELTMYISSEYVRLKGDYDVTTLNIAATDEEIYNVISSLKDSKYDGYVSIVAGKIVVSDDMPNKEWAEEIVGESDDAGNGEEPDTPEETDTPVVAVGTPVTGENATVTGGVFAYNNPVIPVGFSAKETTDATWADEDSDGSPDGWNSGLVIEDENSNEFVWVPVDGANVTYAKNFTYPSWYDATSDNTSDDTDALPKVNNEAIDENDQISKYHGFYIARYEAGVPANQTAIDGTSEDTSDKSGIPVSKKDATVWTNISYTNANANALAFCNTDNVKSGLVTGSQWDTVMKWIENTGVNVSTDSSSWGNYFDSIDPANVDGYAEKQTAGFSEYWKAKNIYDLAGNTWEWTGEIYNSSDRFHRGGVYYRNGSYFSASYRYNDGPSITSFYISFRLVLYVM